MKTVKEVATVCARDCYDTCALIVTLDEAEQILSIKGDKKNPVTRGFTCPRGAKDHDRLYKNRVEAPLLRAGNRFEQTDWNTALSLVSRKLGEILNKHGSRAVLYLDYAGNTGLLTGVFPQRLWNALGATQTDHALCSSSGHKALALHYGASYGVTPIEALSMNLIVFWGFNAAASSSHMWSLARRARKSRGTQIVVIDPRESRTARDADVWVQPSPGSDVALAYGIINYLIQNKYVDLDFIEEWTLGFEQLKKEASTWTPDRIEQITGVAWNQVAEIGEAYGNLVPSATMIGIGLQKCDQGADQVRAVAFIPALLGLHRGFLYGNADSFSVDESLISGKKLTGNRPGIVKQVGLPDPVMRGEFKFIYISCMNPALTLPNQHAFRQGLSRHDVFTVVHETHWTKTAQYADVVLPAPTYLEKDDLVIPWSHNYVRYSNRIVRPITDSRSEIWVMHELAKRLGLTEDWLYEDAWEAVRLALKDAFEEGSFESLKAGAMLKLKRKPRNSYPTSSGKIEFYSSRAEEMGLNPLPTQTPLRSEEGIFTLLTSATPRYTSTQFQEVYGAIPAVVVMNSEDAERFGVENGEIVALLNDRGQVKMGVTISDTVPAGVLWSPRQSEGLAGEPQNCLTSSNPQKIGSGPRFNSTTVTISKHQVA
ncbi:MAG: molybdopterin-dependent oxidoreductase [Anaerolineae bacterium]